MDQGDLNERAGEMTISSIRKSILVLEKAINKNRDMRTKFGGEPEKYVFSFWSWSDCYLDERNDRARAFSVISY